MSDYPGYQEGLEEPGLTNQQGYGDQPSGASHRAAHRRRKSRHPVLRALAIAAAVAVVLLAIAGYWLDRQINPGGRRGPDVAVVIPKGSSTADIGKILAKKGVIHQGSLFAFYARLDDHGVLYPGTYSLPKNSSYHSVLDALHAGPKITVDSLVVPEGFTLDQIAAAVGALPGIGLSAKDLLAAAESGTVRSRYEPAGSNDLEGLLFPATYQVTQGESPASILQAMVDAFDSRASQVDLPAAASRLGMTPYQVVIAASIVEREAKLTTDRGPVASTVYNRLKIGMPLGADSTQTYYLRLTDPSVEPTVSQLDRPSPYNTRLNRGLPPTPISNPGLPSLEAATDPPHTSYLYFVEVNPDGKLGFASNQAGFDSLRRQCQEVSLC